MRGDAIGRSFGMTHKSAPIVALYWLLNRLFTYWFMRDVFPTLDRMYKHRKMWRYEDVIEPAVTENDNLTQSQS